MSRKQDHSRELAAAIDGYRGAEYDHTRHGMLTSTMHAAYRIGRMMQASGRTEPRAVRAGRGDLMHCNDMVFRIHWSRSSMTNPTITRES